MKKLRIVFLAFVILIGCGSAILGSSAFGDTSPAAPVVTGTWPDSNNSVTWSDGEVYVGYYDPGSLSISTTQTQITLDGNVLSGCTITDTSAGCPVSGLAVGTHTFGGVVVDTAGNSGTVSGSFNVVDTDAPVITGTWPDVNNSVTWSDGEIYVGYLDFAPSSGISTTQTQITLDGNILSGCTITDTYAGCPVSGLNASTHTIGGSVTDNSGNQSSVTSSFNIIDSAAPNIAYSAPSGPIDGNGPVISATFSDPAPSSGFSTSSATLSLNNGSATACTIIFGTITCPTSGLADGSYSAVVSLTDNAGNAASASGSFSIDTQVPVITGTWPDANNSVTWSDGEIFVGYFDYDPSSGISSSQSQVTLDGNSLPGCTITDTYAGCYVSGLSPGSHTIAGNIVDNAGNSGAFTSSFSVNDATPPVITATWPDANNPVSFSPMDMYVGYYDPAPSSGVSGTVTQITLDGRALSCSVYVDYADCQVGQELNAGTHVIGGIVADNAGNQSSVSGSFNVLDTSAPVITGTWPDANNPVTWSEGTIYVGYLDDAPSSGISTTQTHITLDSNSLSGCTITDSYAGCPVTGLNPGPHTIGGVVSDNSGNTSGVNSTFYVQGNVPPVVSYSGPSGPTNTSSITVTASFNAQASISGVNESSATLSLNGGAATACSVSGTVISCQTPALIDGTYSVVISIADNAGDVGTATGSFAADRVAPTISGLSPSGHVNAQPVTISAGFYDSGSGINPSSVTVNLDGAALAGCSVTSSSVSCPSGNLGNGAHAYEVNVSDYAGNATMASGGFSIGTYHISTPNGGDCSALGIWNGATNTCTLSNDISFGATDGIHIDSDGVTLDGAGHTINGTEQGWNGPGVDGVYFYHHAGVTIKNLHINNFDNGIYSNGSNNTLIGNNLTSNDYGLFVKGQNNVVSNNTVNSPGSTGYGYGIYLVRAQGSIIRNNAFTGYKNFNVSGTIDDFKIDADTSNLVDGKPIYYIVGASGQTYDASTNAGTFYCIACTNVTIKNQTLDSSSIGLVLEGTTNSLIENITAKGTAQVGSYNSYGPSGSIMGFDINLGSNNNTFSDCNVSAYMQEGIYIANSSGNTISGNTVSGNGFGIRVVANSNTITGNAISANETGIQVEDYQDSSGTYQTATGNTIHYNDIFANGYGNQGQGLVYYQYTDSGNLDASNNYWGSKHGPQPYGFGNGFSGPVNVLPWSRVAFTQAGAAYQASLGMKDYCAVCGDPINTSTGAFVYQHTDVKIPTTGVPLEFDRTYNSNDGSDGDLGFGWSYNWQISVNPLANGNIDILKGDGSQDIFTLNPDGSYSPPSLGVHDTLTKNADGTYKLTSKDQITYNFGSNNELIGETSESGQTTTFTYDSNQQLTTITEPTGRTLDISHDATTGRITQIAEPDSKTVSFAYSALGDLVSVTDQSGGVTSFTYDSSHHMTSVTDPNNHVFANNTYDASGRVIRQTDADGKLLTFTYDVTNFVTTMTRQMDPNDASKDQTTVFYYDASYRLIKETDPYGKDTLYSYDAAGNRDTVTDRRGTVTKQNYDDLGNVTDIYKAYGASEQEHTSYTYNSKNHPLSKTDTRGFTTNYTYDASGSFLTQAAYPQATDYDGNVSNYTESFTYNTDGTKASLTDKNGNVTSYGYDANGNLAAENRNTNHSSQDQVTLSYAYDLMGRKTSATDANGSTTTLQYDNLGNLRFETKQVTDPGTGQLVNVTTENQYDAAGNKTKVIDSEGKATSYAFTPMNRLSQVTDAKLNTVQYTYDAAGNKTGTKDRNGNWTYSSFDKNNRMATATDPESNTTTYTYDEEGNQTAVTDPLGRVTGKTYDRIGRVTSTTEPDEGNVTRTTAHTYDAADNLLTITDPLSHTTTNNYDELDRLKQTTDPLGNSNFVAYDGAGNKVKLKDAKGNETSFGFSPNNFLSSVTDPAGGVTSYSYDKNGNRTQQTDAEGRSILYSYDELNRLKEEKVDAGSGNNLLDRSYAYDKSDHQLTDTTGDGTITSTYDDAYNLIGVTDRHGATYSYTYDANQNQLSGTDNAASKTVSFSYSSRGELSQASDASGGNEIYSYNSVGDLAQQQDTVANQNFTTSYDYTPRDLLKTVTKGNDTTSYAFDAAKNMATKSYANGVSTSYTYDAGDRLTSMQAVKGGQSLQSFSQSFDANSNITSVTEAAGTNSYTYDSLNRLTAENVVGFGTISYGYDHTGNRLSLNSPTTGTTDYYYNQANQLTSSVNGSTTTNFTYNAGGALTQKVDGTNTTSLSYNGLDKLTQETTPAGNVTYSYDALGRRISRTQGAATTSYHFNGKTDLTDYETNGSGSLLESYQRGADGLLSQTDFTGQSPVTSYDLYNPHGDTAAITDQSGNMTGTYRYDSFGNPIGSNGLNNGYTGKWQRNKDGSTGTIRMGAREYDPSLGRFMSADPLQGSIYNPQQRNRYDYVGNNPLTRNDLTGLYWGESFVNAAVGTASDYLTGGTAALEQDWLIGWNSMSTREQVALIGVPVTATAALVTWEFVGPSYAAYELGTEGVGESGSEVANLMRGGEATCPDLAGEELSGIPNFENPAASPGEGWEWRGSGEPGSPEGAWYNPGTGESLHPDVGHAAPVGPHYDWTTPDGKVNRVYPDGRIVPR